MEIGRNRSIVLDDLASNGVVREKYERLDHSVFADIYRRVLDQIEHIVDINRQYVDMNKRWKVAERRKGNDNFEIANVLSFVGRRGTGKTSAMLSTVEVLEKDADQLSDNKKNGLKFKNQDKMKNVSFYCLPCIDVSFIEESEDLFILILSSMFENVLHMSRKESLNIRDYENRELFQKFEKIYDDFITLTRNKGDEGYSAFEKLKNYASSQRIRDQFEYLVEAYLENMDNDSIYRLEKGERYLVISIDDVDMVQQGAEREFGCYKIMNCIYKYLNIPHVIVMASYNHVYLYEQCQEFFRKTYNTRTIDHEKIANQFMEKVFPIYNRFYMPSWRKRDLKSGNEILIDIKNNRMNVLKKYQTENEGKMIVKKFVFALLYEKTGVCFDYAGEKKHFFEPDTLRSLFNTTELLLEIPGYDYSLKEKKDLQGFEYGMNRLKEDCYFRFGNEALINSSERIMFDEWLEQPIELRAENIVKKICIETEKLGLRSKEISRESRLKARREGVDSLEIEKIDKYILDNKDVEYSYAELVHSIFHMTRGKEIYSKSLVSSILYSYTLYMTEIYTRYKWYKQHIPKKDFLDLCKEVENPNLEDANSEEYFKEVKTASDIIEKIIGESVCGRWTEYFFPKMKLINESSRSLYLYGGVKLYILGYVENLKLAYEVEIMNHNDSIIDFKSFIFVSMFYTDVLSWSEDDIDVEFTTEGSETKIKLKIIENRNSDFDMTGCFKNTFLYEKFLNKLQKLLEKKCNERISGHNQDQFKKCQEELETCFEIIWNEYYDWDMKYGNMMLPIYNLDITYNFIKRIFQDCKRENKPAIELKLDDQNDTTFFDEYIKMLDYFCEYMEEIDKAYCLENTLQSYVDTFEKCPFYTMVNELKENISSRVHVTNYIFRMVQAMENDEEELVSPD